MSRSKAENSRNEVKSYITREDMTMTEVVELLADEHGWSCSVPNLSGKLRCGAAPCGTPKPWSWPMCWATIWFGRSAGR